VGRGDIRPGLEWAGRLLAYALILMSVIHANHAWRLAGILRWMLAALPALPVLFIIWVLGRYLFDETDEVIRAKVIEQLLWGAAVALSISTVWGFLEALGGLPHVPAFWIFPLFCLGMMLSIPRILWKYREEPSQGVAR
jgi:hypothetical protein